MNAGNWSTEVDFTAWFEDERRILRCLDGALACVYSRYDSANGFYYPVANHGRLAAGSVATGGGHDDIFKDDLIHLAWAVTLL